VKKDRSKGLTVHNARLQFADVRATSNGKNIANFANINTKARILQTFISK